MIGYERIQIDHRVGPQVAYLQSGDGPVVVLQHGLCGDARQPAEIFPTGTTFRHAVLEARGHGDSAVGPDQDLSIANFADDLAAFIEANCLDPVAVGGISMGAAVALRLAVRRPDLVRALIVSRPAWVTAAAPANMAPNTEIAELLAQGLGVESFDLSPTAQKLLHAAPDNIASLRGFFTREPLSATASLLRQIPVDGPGVTEADLAELNIPVLILASEEDHIHPMAHARKLRQIIANSTLVELPPKGRDRAGHVAACKTAISSFLKGLPHAPPQP
ncbi:MAG: alpha/beta hydrolase [bacterium]